MPNTSGLSPYTDQGTGAYPNPTTPVDYGTEHDPEPTGAVPGPSAETMVESPPEHLSGPTGASPNPPASVTSVQWPAVEKDVEPKAKAVQNADNKAVKKSATKNKGAK